MVARGAAAVQKAGGKVALGAHGQLQGLGVHWELWAHTGVGDTAGGPAMTPHQAWRAATRDAADKLGYLLPFAREQKLELLALADPARRLLCIQQWLEDMQDAG